MNALFIAEMFAVVIAVHLIGDHFFATKRPSRLQRLGNAARRYSRPVVVPAAIGLLVLMILAQIAAPSVYQNLPNNWQQAAAPMATQIVAGPARAESDCTPTSYPNPGDTTGCDSTATAESTEAATEVPTEASTEASPSAVSTVTDLPTLTQTLIALFTETPAPPPTQQEQHCPLNGGTKYDSGSGDVTVNGVRVKWGGTDVTVRGGSASFCVKAANLSGGGSAHNGTWTVTWKNNGGQTPDISYLVLYNTEPDVVPSVPPSPTNTPAPDDTATPTLTPIDTATLTLTPIDTATPTQTQSVTPTNTDVASPTFTLTPSETATATPSFTPTSTEMPKVCSYREARADIAIKGNIAEVTFYNRSDGPCEFSAASYDKVAYPNTWPQELFDYAEVVVPAHDQKTVTIKLSCHAQVDALKKFGAPQTLTGPVFTKSGRLLAAEHVDRACNPPTEPPTNTPTNTPTETPTETPTNTPTFTPTWTPSPTLTNTPTSTATPIIPVVTTTTSEQEPGPAGSCVVPQLQMVVKSDTNQDDLYRIWTNSLLTDKVYEQNLTDVTELNGVLAGYDPNHSNLCEVLLSSNADLYRISSSGAQFYLYRVTDTANKETNPLWLAPSKIAYLKDGVITLNNVNGTEAYNTGIPAARMIGSPNGRWIGYQTLTGNLYVYDVEKRNARPVLVSPSLKSTLLDSWSPDGTQWNLTFASETQTYVVKLDFGNFLKSGQLEESTKGQEVAQNPDGAGQLMTDAGVLYGQLADTTKLDGVEFQSWMQYAGLVGWYSTVTKLENPGWWVIDTPFSLSQFEAFMSVAPSARTFTAAPTQQNNILPAEKSAETATPETVAPKPLKYVSTYTGTSVVEFLASVGIKDTSFASRAKLAVLYGVVANESDYLTHNNADFNIKLISAMSAGG